MTAKRRYDRVRFGTRDHPELAVRDRPRRDRIDDLVGTSGDEREHVEGVRGKDALWGREPGLSPPLVDLRPARATVDRDVFEAGPYGVGHRFGV